MPSPPSAPPASVKERPFSVLRERNFALFVASRCLSATAVMTLRAAVGWQVYEISKSPFHLGLIGIVQFAPALVLSLLGGAVADAYDRRRVVLVAQCIPAAASFGLFWLLWFGTVDLWVLYALVLTVSIGSAFENPSRAALLPQVVTRARFPAAVSIHTALQMLGFMTGPVLMGFLVAHAGIKAPFAAHVLLMVGSLSLLFAVHLVAPAIAPRRINWETIREGLVYVRRSPIVLGCMTLDLFAVLFGGATALLPIFANDILQVGARGYGLLASSLEVGAVLMSLALFMLPPIERTGRALIVAVVGFGLSTVVFGLSRTFQVSLVAYMAAGMFDYISMVMRSIAIQLTTPDELRGRVSAVNGIFIGASNQLGAAESGFVAAATSPTFSVVSGGIGAITVALLVAWLNPRLRNYSAESTA